MPCRSQERGPGGQSQWDDSTPESLVAVASKVAHIYPSLPLSSIVPSFLFLIPSSPFSVSSWPCSLHLIPTFTVFFMHNYCVTLTLFSRYIFNLLARFMTRKQRLCSTRIQRIFRKFSLLKNLRVNVARILREIRVKRLLKRFACE